MNMRRQVFMTMMLTSMIAAQAADFQYLTIEKNDGQTETLTALGLTISYSSSMLTATNGSEKTTIALSDLRRMYFTNTKSKSETTAIEATDADWDNTETVIYDLKGHRLPQGTKPAPGIYIFKKGNTTTKKYVK